MKTSQIIFSLSAIVSITVITAFNLPDTDQKFPFADKFWKLESSVVAPAIDLDMDGKADTDIRVMMEDCEKDDAEMYKTGGKVMKHNGTNKCEEEDEAVVESGTWEYNATTKQLTIKHHDTRKAQTATIKEVSGNRMIVVSSFTSAKGKHTITAVYKAK